MNISSYDQAALIAARLSEVTQAMESGNNGRAAEILAATDSEFPDAGIFAWLVDAAQQKLSAWIATGDPRAQDAISVLTARRAR